MLVGGEWTGDRGGRTLAEAPGILAAHEKD